MARSKTRITYGMRGPGRPKKEYKRPDKPLCEYTRNDVWHEGERIAADYLESRGFDVIARNWRCKLGEADIVALEGDVVVMIEVKCRIGAPEQGVHPEDAVTRSKIARYERIMKYFIMEHPDVHSIRFDVIAINLVSDDRATLRRISNAATWDD